MEKLKTATGKEFDCDYFNPFPTTRQTNLRVLNVPLTIIASVFNDAAETKTLICGGQRAEGYTKLVAIVPEGKAVRVVLEME